MKPIVGLIMGSHSDWKVMRCAAECLKRLAVPFEAKVVSAHRTPDLMYEYARSAESRGLEIIIAGAGGAAHLPGMCAALTLLPVIGVPVTSDALRCIAQMPAGVPVGTMAVGSAGASNAAYYAARILAFRHPEIREALIAQRAKEAKDGINNHDLGSTSF